MSSVRFKRTVISILCFSILFITMFSTATIVPTTTVFATDVDEYQELINQLEQEKKEIESEISELNSSKAEQNAIKTALQKKIDNIQSQINICNNQLSEYANQVKQLEADIETKNEELENTKFLLKQRLRAIYMSGGSTVSSLSILLSSENLSELLTKSELTRSVSAYDNALMEKIVSDVKTIESKKAEISELVKQQEEIKRTLNAKKEELNTEIAAVKSVISGYNSDISGLESQINKIDKAQEEYENAIKAAQSEGSDQYYSGQFAWPCPGYHYITSPFGWRIHPIYGTRKHHNGVDISGGGIKGKPIIAAADGIVSLATYNAGGYGYYVMINHGRGDDGMLYYTLYAHMTKYIVSAGQTVKQGQTIGYVGTSGASTGYHLHFEIRRGTTQDNIKVVNPMSFF